MENINNNIYRIKDSKLSNKWRRIIFENSYDNDSSMKNINEENNYEIHSKFPNDNNININNNHQLLNNPYPQNPPMRLKDFYEEKERIDLNPEYIEITFGDFNNEIRSDNQINSFGKNSRKNEMRKYQNFNNINN